MRPTVPGETDPFHGTHEEIPGVAITGSITAVDARNGIVGVRFLTGGGQRPEVRIPMFQLSVMGANSSWFRFMPQVGDRVTLIQNVDGTMHIANYECVNYAQLADADQEDQFLFRPLKEGEFEIRSAGFASVFGSRLGELRLAGGPATLTLSRENLVATLDAPLVRATATSCEIRFGELRRKFLPTDTEETSIPTFREFKLVVARDVVAAALPMVEVKMGDVVTEVPPYPPALSALPTPSPLRTSMRVLDPTGLFALFGMRVDALGNLEIIQGPTPTGTMVLQPGLRLALGGPLATEPVALGLVLNANLTQLIGIISGAFSALATDAAVTPATKAAASAAVTALGLLIPQLVAHLSTVAFTQLVATPGAP